MASWVFSRHDFCDSQIKELSQIDTSAVVSLLGEAGKQNLAVIGSNWQLLAVIGSNWQLLFQCQI